MAPKLVFVLFIFLMISCDPETPQVFYNEGYLEIADYITENNEQFSRFYELMIASDMEASLNAYNPSGTGYTLFLPTNDAFDRFIEKNDNYSSFSDMIRDEDFVRELGRYHVVMGSVRTNEFPYGAFPDSTGTGDYLTVGFSTDLDSTVYKINNVAPVIDANLEMTNGYIHVIGEVLEPITYTGYDWIDQNQEYSILARAIELTGLIDTLQEYRYTSTNQVVRNRYTILAEHDSIYQRNGIYSIDDLISRYSTPGLDYGDHENELYQYAAYHIMEGSYYLADFESSGNYNTLGIFPISIKTELEVKLNQSVDTFALEISAGGDTSYIDYISLNYQESNIVTRTGGVHFLTQLMEPYKPRPSKCICSFYEEPEISENRSNTGTFEIRNQEGLEVLSWSGPESIVYYRSNSDAEEASGGDYLSIEGKFTINYQVPKILPGRYGLYLRTGVNSEEYPIVQVFVDGNRVGANLDLSSAGTSSSSTRTPYFENKVSSVDFSAYEEHTITIKSLIQGVLVWDYVVFKPE